MRASRTSPIPRRGRSPRLEGRKGPAITLTRSRPSALATLSRKRARGSNYCAAAAIFPAPKAGITSLAKRSRSSSCTSSGVPSGVAQITRSMPG
jgi:hypothetical protein